MSGCLKNGSTVHCFCDELPTHVVNEDDLNDMIL